VVSSPVLARNDRWAGPYGPTHLPPPATEGAVR